MSGLLGSVYSFGDRAKKRLRGLLNPETYTNAWANRADTPMLSNQDLIDGLPMGGLLGATVWHGSPHLFKKFDASKIGTGEGAQAYGHGLYLADSPAVAESYKKAGNQFTPTIEDLIKVVENPGNLYKVDLPDDQIAKMLDWDAPLSQQAPEVRDIMNRVGRDTGPLGLDRVTDDMRGLDWGKLVNTPEGAQMLRRAGIPGIRYLDGASRSGKTGTRNYVVFPGNEELLKILEINGKVPAP